ncbi:hypothetical protein NQ318_005841 [Aromia moschata]|uniref:C2H2-type domain-containing protein n=1 Tax=Aromia moschata TaxID=1265417 RepID=A0AAV8YTP8_9CUCU|nr:hypothetical protein NQ318_005841 [Aromia moschata]
MDIENILIKTEHTDDYYDTVEEELDIKDEAGDSKNQKALQMRHLRSPYHHRHPTESPHENAPIFQCDICQKCFANAEFLKLHGELHSSNGQRDNLNSEETALLTVVSDSYLERCRTTVLVEEMDLDSLECTFTDTVGNKCLRRFGERVAFRTPPQKSR